jgi:hypothetical protein
MIYDALELIYKDPLTQLTIDLYDKLNFYYNHLEKYYETRKTISVLKEHLDIPLGTECIKNIEISYPFKDVSIENEKDISNLALIDARLAVINMGEIIMENKMPRYDIKIDLVRFDFELMPNIEQNRFNTIIETIMKASVHLKPFLIDDNWLVRLDTKYFRKSIGYYDIEIDWDNSGRDDNIQSFFVKLMMQDVRKVIFEDFYNKKDKYEREIKTFVNTVNVGYDIT